MFSSSQISLFTDQGFIIERKLANVQQCTEMRESILNSVNPPLAPVEFETDVQYPGSPADRLSPGGNTPRRLLHAYTRDRIFRDWASSTGVTQRVKQLLDTDSISISQNHHNCVMTKHPGYSSATLWHQDNRYWSFDRPDLVSVWLALGQEQDYNGGMQLIPGSHHDHIERGRFDGALFLRQDLDENQALIDTAVSAQMEPGDVLFFHSRTLHAAGRNNSDQIKTSLVFTYHADDNEPIAGTRSAAYPDIPC